MVFLFSIYTTQVFYIPNIYLLAIKDYYRIFLAEKSHDILEKKIFLGKKNNKTPIIFLDFSVLYLYRCTVIYKTTRSTPRCQPERGFGRKSLVHTDKMDYKKQLKLSCFIKKYWQIIYPPPLQLPQSETRKMININFVLLEPFLEA